MRKKTHLKNKRKRRTPYGFLLGIGVIFVALVVFTRSLPPRHFPVGEIVSVESGASVRTIARSLEAAGFVRSAEWFMVLFQLRSPHTVIVSGDYIFDRPASAYKVLHRLAIGDYGPTQIRFTVPEGSTVVQIAEIARAAVPDFPADEFVELAEDREGYLFPDTYLVFPSVTPAELLELMEQNFEARVGELFAEYEVPEEEQSDIVILASIVEREAFGDNYREHQIVAGILKKRLSIGMRLQVDATLNYINGKSSSQLTKADLRSDSPYNTYTNYGLPPTPISNPGLIAIETTINSLATDYLFYLHSPDGTIHYAENHDQHVANKQRYLR